MVAYACLAASADLRPAALAAGGVGLLLLAVGVLLRKPWLVPWALAAVGGGYAVTRAGAHVVDGWAALVGAGLLLAGELGLSSAGDDPRIAVEGPLLRRRLVTTVALVAVAALVGFVLLGVAAVAASSGLVVAAAGVVAAVAAVGLVLRQLRAP